MDIEIVYILYIKLDTRRCENVIYIYVEVSMCTETYKWISYTYEL